MTSNLGTARAHSSRVGFGAELVGDPSSDIRQAVTGHFPKEILGRIGDVVVFSPLSQPAATEIWDREVCALAAQLSRDKETIEINVDPAVRDRLLVGVAARIHAQGARAVRKLVEGVIADNCLKLLDNVEGPMRIDVREGEEGGVRFRVEAERFE